MRTIRLVLFLIAASVGVWALILGCGDDETPSDSVNHPPYVPYSPSPLDGSVGRSVDSELYWECGDPDGDPLVYTLYFDTVDTPGLVIENHPDTVYYLGTLDAHTTYYWRVVAYDFYRDSTAGPLWNFTTGDSANVPPNEPFNPSPEDNATDQPMIINLSWACTDPNGGDFLNYDIYLGDTVFPPRVASHIAEQEYTTDQLEPETQYYWRVIAFDNQGDSTAGPLWNFTTGVAAEGVFAAMAIARVITPVEDTLFRMDEIVARFDSAYAPCNPVSPLEADGVICNEFTLQWDPATTQHRYVDMVNFSFIELDSMYVFEVSPSASVPELIDSIRFPGAETYLTNPAMGDTVGLDGFTVQWAGAGTGDVLFMILSGNDTTGVTITTENDGEYEFSPNDLAPLVGQSGDYAIMMIHQNETLIDANGYDPRSYIWARVINIVQVYME